MFKELFTSAIDVYDLKNEFIYSFVESDVVPCNSPKLPNSLDIDSVMVGVGGVGQSIAYLLNFFELHGQLHFVDHDVIEKSNLQRYLLTIPSMINVPKVIVMKDYFRKQMYLYRRYNIQAWNVATTLTPSLFSSKEVLVSIDNKRGRNEVQAALPRVIWNAWTGTSPGELRYGFGRHVLGDPYQCLACVYFPKENNAANQTEFNARVLGLTESELQDKLDNDEIFTQIDLEKIANMHNFDKGHEGKIQQLVGSSYRDIFHGQCGILQGKIGEKHEPTPAPHVPTLAASVLIIHYFLEKVDAQPKSSESSFTVGEYSGFHYPTEYNLFKVKRHPKCICNDPIYQQVYSSKWNNQ